MTLHGDMQLAADTLKNKTNEHLEKISFLTKSLTDINRLRILIALENKTASVSVLVEELKLSQPLVSHHLRELRRALLVSVERKGPFVYYSLANDSVIERINDLLLLAEELLAQKTGFG